MANNQLNDQQVARKISNTENEAGSNQNNNNNNQRQRLRTTNEVSSGLVSDQDEPFDVSSVGGEEDSENEENLHERNNRRRHSHHHPHNHTHHHHRGHHQTVSPGHRPRRDQNQLQGQQHQQTGPTSPGGRKKELIKPDPTLRAQLARVSRASQPSSPVGAISSPARRHTHRRRSLCQHHNQKQAGSPSSASPARIATAVDEEQLHKRLMESMSEKKQMAAKQSPASPVALKTLPTSTGRPRSEVALKGARQTLASPRSSSSPAGHKPEALAARQTPPAQPQPAPRPSEHSPSSSRSSSSSSQSDSSHTTTEAGKSKSPPPKAIIIPPNVAKSISMRNSQAKSNTGSVSIGRSITREQLDYGPLLKSGEVQVLYRSPEADSDPLDRHLKDEQAKQVAPNMRQSPIAIMSVNPTYELQNKPIVLEYPATVENLRLNNTGFSWEVKIPYQISMTTSLYGAHLNMTHRYRLDQFHCHWGQSNDQGSEHTVDNRSYSAEMHFVHYNMEKYHTLSKAARHADGLVVMSVFVDAHDDHHNHAELEKIVSHLKSVPLKGEHSIIKQAVRIENLLPVNRSYWSYQGSLTTPPYFESVTWFVLKHPIKCNTAQIDKFRSLKSSLQAETGSYIRSNHRKTQPLHGRTIVNYDEPSSHNNCANLTHHHY